MMNCFWLTIGVLFGCLPNPTAAEEYVLRVEWIEANDEKSPETVRDLELLILHSIDIVARPGMDFDLRSRAPEFSIEVKGQLEKNADGELTLDIATRRLRFQNSGPPNETAAKSSATLQPGRTMMLGGCWTQSTSRTATDEASGRSRRERFSCKLIFATLHARTRDSTIREEQLKEIGRQRDALLRSQLRELSSRQVR